MLFDCFMLFFLKKKKLSVKIGVKSMPFNYGEMDGEKYLFIYYNGQQ